MSEEYLINEEWGLQQIILDTLNPIIYNVVTQDMDAVFVFTGRERLGKSTLAARVGFYCASMMSKLLGNPPEFYFGADKICLTAKEYVESVYLGPRKSVRQYDEAITGWYARRSMSKSNVGLNTMLMTCGDRAIIHLICIPNFMALDADVRYRRVTGVFSVYGKPEAVNVPGYGNTWRMERGFFDYYAGDEISKIYQDALTRMVHFPLTAYQGMRFKGYEKDNPLWAPYQVRSGISKQGIGRDILESLQEKKKGKRGRKAKVIEEPEEDLEDGPAPD